MTKEKNIKPKKGLRIDLIPYILVLMFSILIIYFTKMDFLKNADNLFTDRLFQKRHDRFKKIKTNELMDLLDISKKIVFIDISEETLDTEGFNSWPIRRYWYAKLLDKIRPLGPKVVAFDIFFPEPSSFSNDDKAFAKSASKTKNFIIGVKMDQEEKAEGIGQEEDVVKKIFKLELPYPDMWKALKENYNSCAIVSVPMDRDGIVRMVPMYVKDSEGKVFFNLDARIIAYFYNTGKIKFSPDEMIIGNKKIPLENGCIRVNYYYNYEHKAEFVTTVGIEEVLSAQDDDVRELVKDNIILVGVSAMAGSDLKRTPIDKKNTMPGTYIHQMILRSILEDKYIKPVPSKIYFSLMIILGFITVFICNILNPQTIKVNANLAKNKFMSYLSFIYNPVSVLVICILLFIMNMFLSTYLFINKNLLLPVLPSLLVVLGSYTIASLYNHRKAHIAKKKLSEMFREFAPLPENILDEIIHTTQKAQVGGKLTNVTILFSDIRGYPDFAEKLDPVTVMNTLNEYHNIMGDVFDKNGGIIFDYQGDAQMVVFGLVHISQIMRFQHAVRY
jgi:CHASE2 domain-containing sensor protein